MKFMTIEEFNSQYSEWFETRTTEDLELHMAVLEYEDEYFADMTLKMNSILKDFLAFSYEDGVEDSYDLYCDLEAYHYRYYVKKLEGYAGITDLGQRTITIDPKYAKDKATILHEMLHAHENIISELTPFLRDVLMFCLYKKLKEEVSELDNRILDHIHILHGVEITNQGGNHDILFFLKSLDLDLRNGFRLGTVCAYGRDEFDEDKKFENLEGKIEKY